MKKWQLKEIKDEKTFQGKRTTGSGNRWHSPGDIKSDVFLIDCKQTDKNSYSVSRDTWNKIYEEALFSYRIPMLSLDISGTELVVLSKEDFEKILSTKKET